MGAYLTLGEFILMFGFSKKEKEAARNEKKFWVQVGTDSEYVLVGGNSSTARKNGAVVSCVERIVSRAVEIPFSSTSSRGRTILRDPSSLPTLTDRMFYRRLFETVLYDGEAAVVMTPSGRLRVGTVSNSVINNSEMWTVTSQMDDRSASEDITVRAADIGIVRWNDSGEKPYNIFQKEAIAYQECVDDMYQEAAHARKVTHEVELGELFDDSERVRENLKAVREKLKTSRKYQMPVLSPGLKIQTRYPPTAAPHKERLTESLAAVARVYGVPLPLVMTGQSRATIDDSDSHLLRDAVLPLVGDVASALARVIGERVFPDLRRVGLPSKSGMAGLMKDLGQTGAVTINEIRHLAGLGAVEGGDALPETAGAAERNSGSTPISDSEDDDESNDEA